MSDDLTDHDLATRWRQRAQDVRARAEQTRSSAARNVLVAISNTYEAMARRADLRQLAHIVRAAHSKSVRGSYIES